MKKLNEKISNPIIRLIVVILWYTAITILCITVIPYAIVKGVCNLDYYEDWFDFINQYTPQQVSNDTTKLHNRRTKSRVKAQNRLG